MRDDPGPARADEVAERRRYAASERRVGLAAGPVHGRVRQEETGRQVRSSALELNERQALDEPEVGLRKRESTSTREPSSAAAIASAVCRARASVLVAIGVPASILPANWAPTRSASARRPPR